MKYTRRVAFPYRKRSVLFIDLEKETWSREPLSEQDAKEFVGGRLLALAYWKRHADYDRLDTQWYEAGNPIVIAPGAGADIVGSCCPVSTIVTRSMTTGRLVVTSSSGTLASLVVGCGYSAVVVTGRNRRLTGLSLSSDGVFFQEAEPFHDQTVSTVLSQLGESAGIVVGPAGEHQVPYASIWAGGENVGRGGIGSVFGMKNLKYLAFSPSLSEREPYDPKQFGEERQRYRSLLEKAPLSENVREEGSSVLLEKANEFGWAAIDDFSLRTDGRLWAFSTPHRLLDMDEKNPPMDVCLALGANLEIFHPRHVASLWHLCIENGLECQSAGAVLAWARKMRSRGSLSFLPDLRNAPWTLYARLLDAIAYRKGTGEQLAMSLPALVESYGGAEFAYWGDHLELPPYDVRPLPAQAILVALDDDTLVFPELLHGNRYRRGWEWMFARQAVHAQDLRYAAETLGLDFLTFLPYAERLSVPYPIPFFPQRLFSHLASLAQNIEGYGIGASKMVGIGKQAWKIQQEIDHRIASFSRRYGFLPDSFLLDGRSNHAKPRTVSLARLLDAYWSIRERKE